LHKDAEGAAHVKISQRKKELEECRRSQYNGQEEIDNVDREERERDERCKQTVIKSLRSPDLFPPHTVQYEATHARFRLIRRRKGMPNAALSFRDLSGKFQEGFRYFSGPVGFRKVSGSFQVIFWLNSQNRTGNLPETYRKTCFFTGRILLV
jgi:hypothetical protein